MRLDRRLPPGSHTDSKAKGKTVCKDSFGATAEFLYERIIVRFQNPHTNRLMYLYYPARCRWIGPFGAPQKTAPPDSCWGTCVAHPATPRVNNPGYKWVPYNGNGAMPLTGWPSVVFG